MHKRIDECPSCGVTAIFPHYCPGRIPKPQPRMFYDGIPVAKQVALGEAFCKVINQLSIEQFSNTPDYILAEVAVAAIEAYTRAISRRPISPG